MAQYKEPKTETATHNLNPNHRMTIKLKNARVESSDIEPDEVVLSFPARLLSDQASEILAQLFPNTERMIQRALETEALIDCLE